MSVSVRHRNIVTFCSWGTPGWSWKVACRLRNPLHGPWQGIALPYLAALMWAELIWADLELLWSCRGVDCFDEICRKLTFEASGWPNFMMNDGKSPLNFASESAEGWTASLPASCLCYSILSDLKRSFLSANPRCCGACEGQHRQAPVLQLFVLFLGQLFQCHVPSHLADQDRRSRCSRADQEMLKQWMCVAGDSFYGERREASAFRRLL